MSYLSCLYGARVFFHWYRMIFKSAGNCLDNFIFPLSVDNGFISVCFVFGLPNRKIIEDKASCRVNNKIIIEFGLRRTPSEPLTLP